MKPKPLNASSSFAVVVNDDPTQLTLLSGLLLKAGINARVFTGAEAALADMTANTGALPALVITDLCMPGIDGWRFCRLLRSPEYAAVNHVTILVVSAIFAGDEPDRIAADLGAEAFLPSPVDGKRFIEQVQAILNKKHVQKPLRVLIVEDSKTLAGMLKKTFAAHGYEADTALTFRAAADAFAKTAYDVAVLDYYLPDGMGDILLVAFRAERPDCVCIMMTTDPSPELAMDWMKRGAAAYLRKPFKPEYLMELCANARRERALLRVQDLLEVRTIELRESESKFRTIFETANDSFFVMDQDVFLDCNKKTLEMFDCTREQIIGQPLYLFSPELQPDGRKSREKAQEKIAAALSGQPQFFEWKHSRYGGTVFDAEVSLSAFSNMGKYYLQSIVRDITEHKQAENALRESEAQYRLLADHTTDQVWLMDMNLKATYISPSAEKSRGYTFEETAQIPLKRQLTAESFQSAMEFLSREMPKVMADPTYAVPTLELEFYRKDGSTLWIENAFSLILDENGKPLSILGQGRDITESKRAQEALRSSEAKYRLLADNMSDQVSLMDLDLTPTYISPSVERSRGYTLEEITQLPLKRNLTATSFQTAMDFFAREMPKVMADPNYFVTRSLELEFYRKDGSTFWVEEAFTLIRDESGKPISILAVGREITDRKQAQSQRETALEALRESEEKYRWVMDNMVDVITVMDMDLRFTYVSPSIMRMRGYTAEEATAHTFAQAMTPESLQISTQAFEEEMKLEASGTADPGRSRILEVEQYRKDGSTVWMEVSLSFMRDRAQKPIGIISVSRDITDRKRAQQDKAKLEAQLQQAQKMESVGRLAGGVAHDFNNMLGVILGYTEMAINQVGAGHPLNRHLTQIRNAAQRSASLTKQLLAFARKQTVAPKVLDLNETIESMLKMLQRLIGEDIHLHWLPKADLWPVIMDPSQIDQIMANLCVNARDAIADVGKIVIETENSTLETDYCANHPGFVPGEYLRLAVSDDGCGMDKETQDKLFEPFFTTKEMGKGTGLGLATVYGIVKQNNGFINVYSESGHGTTFTVYLPRYKGKAGQMRSEGPVTPAARGHETILLVEDEAAILEMTTSMLESQGYTVRATGNPGEAISLAREHKGEIHLLMTDVVMPEMNGRDLAKNLLSLYPDIKRLFMSGYTANVIAHHGVLDEGVHFIQKPFSINDLAAKVREVLDGDENPLS